MHKLYMCILDKFRSPWPRSRDALRHVTTHTTKSPGRFEMLAVK